MTTSQKAIDAIARRALTELGDAMPAMDKAGAILKAIQRLSDDTVIKQLAQAGIDMLSFQWACIDDTHAECKRQMGVSDAAG